MPRVSPVGPIKRTSFAVISSLSRVSLLSFALIVQHLQTKKYRTKTKSPHGTLPPKRDQTISTRVAPLRQGESGEALLCFYSDIIPHTFPVVKSFFEIFSFFLLSPQKHPDRSDGRHHVHRKNQQKNALFLAPFFTRMFFHKKNRGFSSQLMIYKSTPMLYNSYAVGNRRQVPFVAHCEARLCEMSIS